LCIKLPNSTASIWTKQLKKKGEEKGSVGMVTSEQRHYVLLQACSFLSI